MDETDLDDMTLVYALRFIERQGVFATPKRILQFLDPEGVWKDVPLVREEDECGAV